MDHHGLSPRQARFVSAMIVTRTVADAARMAGIGERTAYTYLADPAVQAAIGRGLDDVLADATRQITGTIGPALAALESILQDPTVPASARVAAARLLLDAGLRYRTTLDLATRLANVEDRQRTLEDEPPTPGSS